MANLIRPEQINRTRAWDLSGSSQVDAPNVSPATTDDTKVANTAFVQDAIAEDFLDFGTVGLVGAADEGVLGQVAGQPHAAADDDIAFGTAAPQPLAARGY